MPGIPASSMHRIVAVILAALVGCSLFGLNAVASENPPSAPTIPDVHQYFKSLVSANSVTVLYETRSRNGDILGFESFPVQEYSGLSCSSEITLKNGVKVDIDWTVVEKSQLSDNTLSILQGHDVQFKFFHMVSVEGGVVVEPSNAVPRLTFGINDEVSRNRLSKAIDLMSSVCRSKSKFD